MDIEKVYYNVFKNTAIDEIMKKNSNLTESEANNTFDVIEKNINIFDNECFTNGYFSKRFAIMNRIKNM